MGSVQSAGRSCRATHASWRLLSQTVSSASDVLSWALHHAWSGLLDTLLNTAAMQHRVRD